MNTSTNADSNGNTGVLCHSYRTDVVLYYIRRQDNEMGNIYEHPDSDEGEARYSRSHWQRRETRV